MDNNKSGVIVLEGQNLSTINSNTSLTNNPSGDTGIPNTPIVGNDNVNSNVGTLNIPVVNDDNNAIQNNQIYSNTISVDASSIVPVSSSVSNPSLNASNNGVTTTNINNGLQSDNSTVVNANPITSIMVDNSSDESSSNINVNPSPNNTIISIDTVFPSSGSSEINTSSNLVNNNSSDNINLESNSDNLLDEVSQNVLDGSATNSNEAISVRKYLGYMFLFLIPVIGQIMLIVKSFDKKDKGISNYAKAQILFAIIMFFISFVFTFVFVKATGTSISDIFHTLSNNYSVSYN